MSVIALRRAGDTVALSGDGRADVLDIAVVPISPGESEKPEPEATVRCGHGSDTRGEAHPAWAHAMTDLPLDAAKAGDAKAIREIVEALTPDAFRVAVSVLGEHHPELDDAVQVGILTVIEQLGAFRREGGFRSFAMRIVSRTALGLRRSDRRTARLTERIRSSESHDPDEEAPDETSEPADASLRRVLSELLQKLPEEQAETLLLRVVLDYDLPAIAAETGVPVNTVRSRFRLAREALRRRIERAPHLMDLAEGRVGASREGGSDDE
jgi:RNA polymerase sigma factor (sigma-70 family)